MTDSFSFYGGRAGLPPPYLKKLPTPNDEEALYVRENGLINGPLIGAQLERMATSALRVTVLLRCCF